MLNYIQRRQKYNVSHQLKCQFQNEQNYWKSVLKRVIAVIITLAKRGLPFRGSNEHFGFVNNGNYLGMLELVAKFDPFLKDHISRYGDQGKTEIPPTYQK